MPLRGFPRNTFPTVLPSQSKGLHRASFPGLVWYARMRYGQGDSATNAAASSWDAPSIAFGTFTSFAAWACRTPPSPHESTRQNAPLLTCTTCPRHPAQRACLKNLNGSFRSPPSKSPLATCRNRTLTRLGWPNQTRDSAEQLPSLTTPKAGSCPRRCGYTRRKSSEVRGWHSEFDTSPQVPASPQTAFCIPPILSTLTFDLRLLLFQTLGYLAPRHFRPTARRECLGLKDR